MNRLKILLLDDSESDVALIQRQFAKQELLVDWTLADTQAKFIAALAFEPDVIISDVQIPGFGAEVALKILSEISGPTPPLVVISGLVGEEIAVEMMKAGAKDFVVKSNLKRLSSAVVRAIRESHLERIESEQRERAEAAIRDRERLLEIVSHDLKNPLGAMTLNLQLLEENFRLVDPEKATPTDQRSILLLERIKKSVIRVDRLIRDVLDQAKIEAGKFVISPHRASMRGLVSELEEIFSPLATARDVKLVFEVELDNDQRVLDQERIFQVLANLISNAIKFTAVGSMVKVVVEDGDGILRFSVKDQGPGISEPEKALVFTKFWQAPDRQKFGTGLGLSIAREIVRGHHGQIGVESFAGNGSEFWFEIPQIETEDSLSYEGTELRSGEKLTILLLEDDEDLREVMEETLKNDTTDVVSIGLGAQALEALQNGLRPQVFIIDHDLPGMTGAEFLRRAFDQKLILPQARVVLTSAHPDLKDRASALGLTLTLQKPFSLRRLTEQVELWRRPRLHPLNIQTHPNFSPKM